MKTTTTFFLLFALFNFSIGQDLELDLQGYYRFNSNLMDQSPSEIEGTGFSVTAGFGIEEAPETCYLYNGTNTYIDLGSDDRNITDKISLSAWIKTTDAKRQFVISKYNSDEGLGYFLGVEDGMAFIGGRNGGSQFIQCYGVHAINDGEWHHIVGIIEGNSWKIFVDCTLENTVASSSNNIELNCSDILTIGNWHQGNGLGEFRFFDGFIDEARIYNRALTDEEMQMLCNLQLVDIKDRVDIQLQEIKIIPNPISETFEVVFNKPLEEKINYIIYDNLGRSLKSGVLDRSISIADLAAGHYILNLFTKNQLIATEALIKK